MGGSNCKLCQGQKEEETLFSQILGTPKIFWTKANAPDIYYLECDLNNKSFPEVKTLTQQMQINIPAGSQLVYTTYGLFLSGGLSENEKIKREVYHWTDIKDKNCKIQQYQMLYQHAGHVFIYYKKALFAIGGFSEKGVSRFCEQFDCEKQQWIQIPDIPEPVVHSCGIGHLGHIYIFGGLLKSEQYSDKIFKYDQLNVNWTQLRCSLPMPNFYQFAQLMNQNELLIAGGQNSQEKAFVFNFEKEKFTQELEGPDYIFSIQAVNFEDKIFAANKDFIFIFDMTSQKWEKLNISYK